MIDDKEYNSKSKKLLIKNFDTILGLDLLKEEKVTNIPKEIKELLKERDSLRNEKKWKEADKVRDKIKTLGYLIEDTSEGQAIKKIN